MVKIKESTRSQHSEACVVFSHPNHELAVFGMLQQLRPNILYLTDGGGETRVAQTKLGLASIDLLAQATFLNYSEGQFYDALVEHNVDFYRAVSAQIRGWLTERDPARVFCDAVEFYNPVHDMALPLVMGASAPENSWEIFEIPLIYQSEITGPAFELQRMPEFRTGDIREFLLSPEELSKKLNARGEIYRDLSEQMGSLLSAVSADHARTEIVARAHSPLTQLGKQRVLRYEARAELLRASGAIRSPIRYAQNYAPMVAGLCPLL